MKRTVALILLLLLSRSAMSQDIVVEDHSATKALCLSILPGGGQIYNHQAWKVPVIYGAFAGVGYFIYTNYTQMKKFKDEYLFRIDHNDTPNLSDYASYPTSSIRSYYNSYNRYFQLSIIIAAGFYALNLVDAYVFGHLFDFRIDDDISMGFAPVLQPMPDGLVGGLGCTLRF